VTRAPIATISAVFDRPALEPPFCGSGGARPGRKAYRLRLRARIPRRLPLLLKGRRRGSNGGGPPMEGRRGTLSLASLTLSWRPVSSLPSSVSIALAASSSDSNSTKAKPRGRPVARSSGRMTSVTVPTVPNRSRRSWRVLSKLRFPTKALREMIHLSCNDPTNGCGLGAIPGASWRVFSTLREGGTLGKRRYRIR
jgi:hypothetical protein